MKYLTDGLHLYEIAAQRTVQNYGRRGGTISYTIDRGVAASVSPPLRAISGRDCDRDRHKLV